MDFQSIVVDEYKIDPVTNVSKQNYVGSTGVNILRRKKVKQGETYSLRNEVLHSVEVKSEYALSLLIQGKQIKPVAVVLKSHEKANKSFKGIGIGRLTTKQTISRFSELAEILINHYGLKVHSLGCD